ncbi:MAG: methyltransferase domain-containing protein [Labilithrix sp.]|nr:methyltransferase domain-containing protein [Labilithrix sp.]
MSGDGPSKATPGHAEPLDDIILGDDDGADVPPPVAPRPTSPPPIRSKSPASVAPPALSSSSPKNVASVPPPSLKKERPSTRVKAATEAEAKEAQGRKRAKMTLRIPDDEISRPNLPATTPAGGVPAVSDGKGSVAPPAFASAEAAPITSPSRPPSSPEPAARSELGSDSTPLALARPMTGPPPPLNADDTLELPSDQVRARLAALVGAPAGGIDATHEPGWTPYQPEVARDLTPIKPTPIVELRDEPKRIDGADGRADPRGTVLDSHEVHNSSPPISDDIPVDMDLSSIASIPDPSSDELATHPRLPLALDSEDIRIDDGDRVSETGEVEVAPEDLVSVESLPSPAYHPPPVKTAGKYPAFKPDIATASSPGAVAPAPSRPTGNTPSQPPPGGPLASPVATPQAPPVATPQAPPIAPAALVPPVAPATPPPATAPSTMAARRPSNPLVFVPPVGALAPPPMTDTAAMRKKTRPWWEELFNDDFIRTMAKVTDGQIGKEVSFIEESLGCEAGAMILDLACGTGRHAVELAARGYQVVGFDLSLAMLARASDEAQDRKQKINFVQGDMREMTFEETFDGVYSWNTSFGYFDEEKNGAVIARVHKALKKGGQFLLDVVNRDYIVRQAPSLAWFEGDGCICMDEMTIDFITSRMKVKRTLMMDDGRTKEIEYSIRAYALHELGKMLHDNGFRVAEVSGRTGTPGVFFGCESPRTLILAEKR